MSKQHSTRRKIHKKGGRLRLNTTCKNRGNGKSKKNIINIPVKSISQCHPGITQKSNRCLPDSIYQSFNSIKNSLHSNLNGRVNGKVNGKMNGRIGGKIEAGDHYILDKLVEKGLLNIAYATELREKYLRPRMPDSWKNDPDEWLDNFNIRDVMKQYEAVYPWFEYMGNFPIDFSAPNPYDDFDDEEAVRNNRLDKCLNPELCTLDLFKKYDEGKRGIGIIFNLDKHDGAGTHWMGMYIDIRNINNPKIYYFDSFGYKVPYTIGLFMKYIRSKMPDANVELLSNGRQFQMSRTECGMYSLYFLINMIHGIPFRQFVKRRVPDSDMLLLRSIIFSK
jgi:hypothetical protein